VSGYRLYWALYSGAFPVEVMLEKAGVPFEGIKLNLYEQDSHREDFLKLNPRGQVPTLLLPDGTVMTESVACCLYLGDKHPESGLMPPVGDPIRPTLLRWLIFAATQIYEDDLRIYYPERYTSEAKGEPAVATSAMGAFDEHFAMVVDALFQEGPTAFPGRLTILDVYLAMLATWLEDGAHHFKKHPALGRLVEAVLADPVIARVWKRYELDIDLPIEERSGA